MHRIQLELLEFSDFMIKMTAIFVVCTCSSSERASSRALTTSPTPNASNMLPKSSGCVLILNSTCDLTVSCRVKTKNQKMNMDLIFDSVFGILWRNETEKSSVLLKFWRWRIIYVKAARVSSTSSFSNQYCKIFGSILSRELRTLPTFVVGTV